LPDTCDVLVVGAGPAGSACAQVLARAGQRVVLVDVHTFPREKICGDGLVPDTHDALARLGLLDRVLAQALSVPVAHCVAPSGLAIDVPGTLAVLPRRELDALLCASATEAGALMAAPVRFEQPLRDGQGRVCGARVREGDLSRDISARWVVLATGASPTALLASDMCERRAPSGVAVRAYVRHAGVASEMAGLHFTWHPRLRGGYGWIFPGPDGVLNIGVGILSGTPIDGKAGARKASNLRDMFDHFVAVDPVAARLWREGEILGDLKGAPLRCDLDGARWSAPGMLVVGDAVGSTYALTGEGIGKALETGIAAAEAMLAAGGDASVQARYAASLNALKPRFDMYRKAVSFNRHPWLISLVVWRARRSARIISRLADILGERRMPGTLLSWRGLRSLIRG
jgi:geranylgeranyl reductase family protein